MFYVFFRVQILNLITQMKALKNGCFTGLFLALALATQAQIAVGVRGGATLAKTTGNGFIENFTGQLDYIVSGNGAVFLTIPLGRGFSFRPEIGYVQSGAGTALGTSFNVVGVDMPISGTVRQRLTYVQAPLLLQYEFGQAESSIKPYVIVGPTLGYLVDGKIVSRANLLIFRTQPTKIDIGLGTFNRLEVGGAVGAGFSFDLGISKLFIEGRYERGFTRVYDTSVVRLPVHNQSFSLLAGFAIPLGR
ncbi:MAG: PorT family protein [Cytophagia bacterium]|nr:MAG: PorT family protein [Cytophagales bacterium]TAG37413.1 MAG: PorT family protein [Cytophagia bacterium]TAG50787.1 MAG: PorT family protein [Runella slithyformis]TAG78454.1 MAG: PorT family protein [Cytophagales bacterium]